jgi:hypothetical protein
LVAEGSHRAALTLAPVARTATGHRPGERVGTASLTLKCDLRSLDALHLAAALIRPAPT